MTKVKTRNIATLIDLFEDRRVCIEQQLGELDDATAVLRDYIATAHLSGMTDAQIVEAFGVTLSEYADVAHDLSDGVRADALVNALRAQRA
jgi:hypothetical protein